MNRETWHLIKQSKNFNVNIYRRGLMALICSLTLSGLLVVLIFYSYIRQPARDFYATNGVSPPIMLKAMPDRNWSSEALLEPDPPLDNVERVIPQ